MLDVLSEGGAANAAQSKARSKIAAANDCFSCRAVESGVDMCSRAATE